MSDESLDLLFAKAVRRHNRSNALLVNEDNSRGEWVPLESAAELGCAFTIEYRADLLPLDGDSDDSIQRGFDLVQSAEAEGVPGIIWASGRPGHAQVILVTGTASVRSRWAAEAAKNGFTPRGASRPPLAPHRLGLPVRLLHPQTPDGALALLRRPPAETKPRLSGPTWERVRWGDPKLTSGSEVVYRIAQGAAAVGYEPEHLFNLLVQPGNIGGRSIQKRVKERGLEAARTWFHNYVWKSAIEYVQANPPIRDSTSARAKIAMMRETARGWRWKPVRIRIVTTGSQVEVTVSVSSVRRALEGVHEIAIRSGTITPYVSSRHLADVAGIGSAETVRRSLQALVSLGWIKVISVGSGRSASKYRLTTPQDATQ